MQKIDLNNWIEFMSTIDGIRTKYGYHEYSIGDDQTYKSKNTVLFRGQGCEKWSLQTTLERKIDSVLSVTQYLYITTNAVHEFESYTGNDWGLPDSPILLDEIR